MHFNSALCMSAALIATGAHGAGLGACCPNTDCTSCHLVTGNPAAGAHGTGGPCVSFKAYVPVKQVCQSSDCSTGCTAGGSGCLKPPAPAKCIVT
ncbi:hypothetical protein BDZ90DRAFT_257764 [Jaminaea rosea]|uniref:Uncharacterized protein n=1 Tax=Jaminaea rosea TaxID=1569628 RepID=A0A316V5K4_9BASI|nr:hypothetical protein BDZ90DRAFT_257764 [Jaminaea rosea]PWN30695.1 hypothetical protein BDZ90DRAFT_257764 [Jaminaea rosea]